MVDADAKNLSSLSPPFERSPVALSLIFFFFLLWFCRYVACMGIWAVWINNSGRLEVGGRGRALKMPKSTSPIPHYITYVAPHPCMSRGWCPVPPTSRFFPHLIMCSRSGTGRDLYIQNVYMKPVAPVLQQSLRDGDVKETGPVEIPRKR